MLSCQSFFPPSHGGASGKFAPPATMSLSFSTPANGEPKPEGSGMGGSFSHFKVSFKLVSVVVMQLQAIVASKPRTMQNFD